jgi:hypothetical protein
LRATRRPAGIFHGVALDRGVALNRGVALDRRVALNRGAGLGPQGAGVGVDAEHDLRLALGDARREDVAEGGRHGRREYPVGMSLQRVAWTVTVLVALLTAALLLLAGYTGYAGLSLAVGISAAINLF